MRLLLLCIFLAASVSGYTTVIDWRTVVAVSNTTTTLQVVANPLLNPATSPVASRISEVLASLNADLVRYVPWFPYPRVGVAELEPPNRASMTTSWSFKDIIPQLYWFMNATYAGGSRVVPNFSTQPTWMYDTPSWDYPEDPNAVDWGYPRGNSRANTTQLVAEYYGRLLSWLVNGNFTDEFGVLHTGGPKYELTHWEVYNEPQGCHGIVPQTYNDQYDAVVTAIRQMADPQHKIKFVGLASGGIDIDYITTFLDSTKHAPGIPLDYVSFHFYAGSDNRTDPKSYEQFFPQAEGCVEQFKQVDAIRKQLSPTTKLSCDEMGVILPNDNDADAPNPHPLYWNAAGAMYAYLAAEGTKVGIEILGESQLAGSPPIPQWDIPDAQFPSVSMVNWTNGNGNARLYVLKLLIEEFAAGDLLVNSSITPPTQNATNPMCGKVDGHVGYGNMTLQCADPNAVISTIDFAAYGTPTGTCGNYKRGVCDASNVTAVVNKLCLNHNSCTVGSYPFFGDPCFQVYKDLIIQASCSGSAGGYVTPSDPPAPQAPYAQGYITSGGKRKVLLVNRSMTPLTVTVPGAEGGIKSTVDFQTFDREARRERVDSDVVVLDAYAVTVVTFPLN